jgi:aryl-alcohol dehydrogenase-like predicted oxidoreductase
MEYRNLGATDLRVSVVSFGAWAIGGSMWGGTDDDAAVSAIQAAADHGVTCIDTAAIYGMGHSERLVGKAIAGRRDKLVIATKCGLRWDLAEGQFFFKALSPDGRQMDVYRNLRPASIRHECEQSLKRLGIDYIDLYQCHWPDPTSNLDDTMATLLDLRREGKIRHIGVSNFTVEMMQQCMKIVPLASDQPKYNALEREVEADVLPFCAANNIGVLAYSPMAMGLLTGKVTVDREFKGDDTRASRPWFTRENRQRVLDMLEKVKPIAQAHDATIGNVFVNWILRQKGMTTALVGARNARQAAENTKAGEFALSDEEVKRIRGLVEELGGPV